MVGERWPAQGLRQGRLGEGRHGDAQGQRREGSAHHLHEARGDSELRCMGAALRGWLLDRPRDEANGAIRSGEVIVLRL